jgi:hypothetical protein
MPTSLLQYEMLADVRFGSLADMCAATIHVRFTPKADIRADIPDVRFVPIADMEDYSATDFACSDTWAGSVT